VIHTNYNFFWKLWYWLIGELVLLDEKQLIKLPPWCKVLLFLVAGVVVVCQLDSAVFWILDAAWLWLTATCFLCVPLKGFLKEGNKQLKNVILVGFDAVALCDGWTE
jgi:hypothetical protein